MFRAVPLRSILKQAVDYGDRLDATLIYVDRTEEDFPFRQEITAWARSLPGFRARFMTTAREGRLTVKRLGELLGASNRDDCILYLAGAPAMVTATEEVLETVGVASNVVRADPFEGY